jgi:hypothetical protein
VGPASPLLAAGGPTLVSRGTRKTEAGATKHLTAAFLKCRFSGRPASAHLLATKQWRTAPGGVDSRPRLVLASRVFSVCGDATGKAPRVSLLSAACSVPAPPWICVICASLSQGGVAQALAKF